MDYQKHYSNLINRSKNRQIDSYTETHHIIPRCMGGTDDPENLVELTPEEHLIAHLLLHKINDDYRLLYAAMRMHNRVLTNKGYGYLRRKFSEMQKIRCSGESNPMYGKSHTEEAKNKISKANKGRIFSEETKKLWSEMRKGKPSPIKGRRGYDSEETRKKKSRPGELNGMHGKKHSAETRQKIGIKSVGRKPRLGAILSEESKRKCSMSAKNRKPIKCVHCQKSVSPGNHKRWHDNNCKEKGKNAETIIQK